jgi:hypothetical protein
MERGRKIKASGGKKRRVLIYPKFSQIPRRWLPERFRKTQISKFQIPSQYSMPIIYNKRIILSSI